MIGTMISLQWKGRHYHCERVSCINAIGLVVSLRTEESLYRYEKFVTMLGMNEKRMVVAPMLIWPNIFYIFNFMVIYLDDILVSHNSREEYLVNFK